MTLGQESGACGRKCGRPPAEPAIEEFAASPRTRYRRVHGSRNLSRHLRRHFVIGFASPDDRTHLPSDSSAVEFGGGGLGRGRVADSNGDSSSSQWPIGGDQQQRVTLLRSVPTGDMSGMKTDVAHTDSGHVWPQATNSPAISGH